MAERYITNDNVEATDRAAKDVVKVGRAVASGFGDAAKNVSRQYDSNVRDENKSIEKPKPIGTDYAERVATQAKDYGTRASAQGVKGTMPSYKHGTDYVPKTGPAVLHEGERVVTKEDNMKHNDIMSAAHNHLGGEAAKPKKEIDHIRTKKAKSGGYIHEHHHTHPEHHPMESHVSADQEAMVGHMMEHMGEPNPGEASADAGQGGVPNDGAAPAAAPAAAA